MQRIAFIVIFVVAIIAVVYFLNSNNKESSQTNVTPTPASGANETSEMVNDPALVGQEAAMNAVRNEIASTYNVEVEMVDITSVEAKEWPDACLGLPAEGEMCAQMITTGYEIKASAQGQEYTYRTNSDGTIIREE